MKKNQNVNNMIDEMDKVCELMESRLVTMIRDLVGFSGEHKDMPALFAQLTWKLHDTSVNLKPTIKKVLFDFIIAEDLDVTSEEDK